MTSHAAPTVYRCPACGGLLLQAHLRSFNTHGAQYWSDGYASYMSSVAHSPLIRCPSCPAVLWCADLEPIGTLPVKPCAPESTGWLMRLVNEMEHGDQRIQREWDAAPAEWRAAVNADRPDYADLQAALATLGRSDWDREIAIRRRIWWLSNHHNRGGLVEDVLVPVEAARENMRRLIDVLGWAAGSVVEEAELLRHMGRFDEAIVVAALLSASAPRFDLASKIIGWARAGDAELKKVTVTQ